MSPGGYKGRKKCRVKGEFSLAEPRVGIQLENYLGNIRNCSGGQTGWRFPQ